MKLSLIAVAALSAVSVNAIAIAVADANPSPEAFCMFRKKNCWNRKRAVDAFSQALQSSGGYKESRAADISNHPGGAAYHAKRSFEELAALVASAYPDPETLYKDLNLAGAFGPDSNLTEADGSEGEPAAPPPGFEGPSPGVTGPEEQGPSQLAARDEAAIDPRWCFWKGQGCWKRTDENTSAVQRRDAAPAFCPFGGEAGSVCYASKRDFIEADKRACEQPGEACHKARTAAEALIRTIEESAADEPTAKRDTTSAAKDVEARWCFWKGQGCWKRDGMDEVVARCNSPSGACTAARRDLTSMHAAARNLLDSLDAEVV